MTQSKDKRYQNDLKKKKTKKLGTIINAVKNVEKLDHFCITNGNIKRYSHSGKEFGIFLKNETCSYHRTDSLTPGHSFQRDENMVTQKRVHKYLQQLYS